jgi:hypothetical protein
MRRNRTLRIETLDRREMLSVSPIALPTAVAVNSAHVIPAITAAAQPSGQTLALSGALLPSRAATLNAPTNVKAAFVASTNQMQISWNASSGAASYNVYRNTVNNPNAASAISTGVSGLSFVDNSPVPGTSYYYWVKAWKGATASPFSTAAQNADSDHFAVVKKSISVNALLQVINITKDMVDDINDILAWDPAPKPSVSAVLDCLSASETENLLETPAGAIVSGTAEVSASESGHVTGQYTAGIPHILAMGLGVTVYESCNLNVAESYSRSSGWVVNPSASEIVGAVSATGFGTATVAGYTGEIDLNVPSVTFVGTLSGQVRIQPYVSVNVGYKVSGPWVNTSGTLYQSRSLELPQWTFNLASLPI